MGPTDSRWSKLPCKVKLFISAMSVGFDIVCRSDGTINRTLLNLFDFKSSASSKPIKGVKSTDITIDKSRDLWFRLYTPTATATEGASLPVIFYFHGGGFCLLAANSTPMDKLCYRLAGELSAFIVSVNYRLTPEHRFPAQSEDGFDTLKFIDETEIPELSRYANLKHCFVAGDSAGGNLTHQVILKASEHEFSNIEIIGNIGMQPFFGGEERTESEKLLTNAPFITLERTDWMWRAFSPEGDNRDHPAVNIFGPNAVDISGIKFPPTIVIVGGFDPLQDWQKRYYEGLRKSGKEAFFVEYPNMPHLFYIFDELAESGMAIQEVNKFIAEAISIIS